MRLTTRSRFGLRFMLELALNHNKGVMDIKDIARKEDISEKYLGQLVIILKSAGLVSSIRGMHGGYVLSKDPSEIKLIDIIEHLEGSLEIVPCTENPSACDRASVCATREVWTKIRNSINNILSSITLADLVKIYKEKQEANLLYNI